MRCFRRSDTVRASRLAWVRRFVPRFYGFLILVAFGFFRLLVPLDEAGDGAPRHPDDDAVRDPDVHLLPVDRRDHAVDPAGRDDLVPWLETRHELALLSGPAPLRPQQEQPEQREEDDDDDQGVHAASSSPPAMLRIPDGRIAACAPAARVQETWDLRGIAFSRGLPAARRSRAAGERFIEGCAFAQGAALPRRREPRSKRLPVKITDWTHARSAPVRSSPDEMRSSSSFIMPPPPARPRPAPARRVCRS